VKASRLAPAIGLLAGLVFGVGLLLSGMSRPKKVLGFLDVTGAWDPSLAFVMGGAIGVGVPLFALAGRTPRTWLGEKLELVKLSAIDARLVLGSIAFGVGWGLVGFCPGPAVVAVGTGSIDAITFFVSMIAGMGLYRVLQRAGLASRLGTGAADDR
jgi:uncharacterized protein